MIQQRAAGAIIGDALGLHEEALILGALAGRMKKVWGILDYPEQDRRRKNRRGLSSRLEGPWRRLAGHCGKDGEGLHEREIQQTGISAPAGHGP
ncbi:hypothetical protein [Acidithiobacillus sp.]